MRPARYTFPAADRDGICLAQTLVAAGALTINGALAGSLQPGLSPRVILPGIQRTVTVYSAADLSLIDFTITGFDLRGAAVTETIAGPDTTPDTVTTTAQYHIITGVSASDAVGTAVEIGTGSTGVTAWWTSDHFQDPVNLSLYLDITATASVTVQSTPDDVQTNSNPTVFNHPTLAAKTSSDASNYAYPPGAVRAVMNSSSGNGAFVFTLIQAGV
jgi:hypothetical protein